MQIKDSISKYLLAPVQGCMNNEDAAGSKSPQSGHGDKCVQYVRNLAHFTCMWNILGKHVARQTCWSEWAGGSRRRISAGRKEIEIKLRFAQALCSALTQGGGDGGGSMAFTERLNLSAVPPRGKFPPGAAASG